MSIKANKSKILIKIDSIMKENEKNELNEHKEKVEVKKEYQNQISQTSILNSSKGLNKKPILSEMKLLFESNFDEKTTFMKENFPVNHRQLTYSIEKENQKIVKNNSNRNANKVIFPLKKEIFLDVSTSNLTANSNIKNKIDSLSQSLNIPIYSNKSIVQSLNNSINSNINKYDVTNISITDIKPKNNEKEKERMKVDTERKDYSSLKNTMAVRKRVFTEMEEFSKGLVLDVGNKKKDKNFSLYDCLNSNSTNIVKEKDNVKDKDFSYSNLELLSQVDDISLKNMKKSGEISDESTKLKNEVNVLLEMMKKVDVLQLNSDCIERINELKSVLDCKFK